MQSVYRVRTAWRQGPEHTHLLLYCRPGRRLCLVFGQFLRPRLPQEQAGTQVGQQRPILDSASPLLGLWPASTPLATWTTPDNTPSPADNYRMFTARAASRARVAKEMVDCTIMATLAQRESTGESVGEKAVLVLKARKR